MSQDTQTRRNELADWLFREHAGAPYTTQQIVDVSGIYDGMQGRWDKCHADLTMLWKNNVVIMYGHRPKRWAHANA